VAFSKSCRLFFGWFLTPNRPFLPLKQLRFLTASDYDAFPDTITKKSLAII
jgi:hypothetical protein